METILINIIILLIGLVLLWKCADLLVSGAVGLAEYLGVSPIIISLTVVSIGTSAPEIAASVSASLKNAGDIAIGNVYGSNIANLAFVGGLTAIILPIRIKPLIIIKREIPIMVLVALLLLPVIFDGYLGQMESAFLLIVFAGLLSGIVIMAQKQRSRKPEIAKQTSEQLLSKVNKVPQSIKKCVLFILFGLAGITIGADISVRSATTLGEMAGLSQAVIGLTIIALGTSLPELATSLVAAMRQQEDISIGNLVGSNVFNTLLVTGTAGIITPFQLNPRLAGTDYWIMLTVSVVFALAVGIGVKKITRTGGVILLSCYLGYMVYLLVFTAKI
jgi:cation:H+ antiporter